MVRYPKQCNDLYLEVVPELGGCIGRLTWRNIDILRPLPDQADSKVNQGGGYPLIPYSNRVAYGRFEYGGQQHQLTPNFGDHPHSIHGNGWQRAWEICAEDDTSITLGLTHDASLPLGAAQWPWSYRATLCFTVQADQLDIRLSYHNITSQTVPVGLGFHPYFVVTEQTMLRYAAKAVLVNDALMLPEKIIPVPKAWDYSAWRPIEAGSLDNCFIDWDGVAQLYRPQEGVTVTLLSPQSPHAVVFFPKDPSFIALEPVSHSNDALNNHGWGDNALAMATIAPNEQLEFAMSIKVGLHE